MPSLRSFFKKREKEPDDGDQRIFEGRTKEDKCPSCRRPLDERPNRKKKCPHCGQLIYVRKPFLMTEKESQFTDWEKRLEKLNVPRSEIDKHRTDLAKQFGFDPHVRDVIWRILNSVVARNTGVHEAKTAYLEMAHIVRSEGKSPTPYLAEAAKLDLIEIKRNGIAQAVGVNTANDHHVCPKCRSLENRTIPLDEALSTLPVPNDCENKEGCRCWYRAVFEL